MDIKTLRFGVELETVGLHRRACAMAIQSVVGGEVRYEGGDYNTWVVVGPDGRKWVAMSDNSLTGGRDGENAEVVSPILSWSDFGKLQEIVRALRHAGAALDDSCGMHVHVDGAPFLEAGPRTVANLVKATNKYHALLMCALGVSASRLAQWCKPVPQSFVRRMCGRISSIEALASAWYGGPRQARESRVQRYDESRYHGVNLHSLFYRGTIEFRWFEGTLHAGRVKANVQLCLALACKALNSKAGSARPRALRMETLKFDLWSMISNLSMGGADFATARHHLLARLPAGTNSWAKCRAIVKAENAARRSGAGVAA